MVVVHFAENLSNVIPPITGLGAPLFTLLSGVSYRLWLNGQQRRGVSDEEISKISIRRGLFVFGVGLAFNIIVWLPEDTFIWDVLTFIGAALLLLNLVRRLPVAIPITMALLAVAISPALRASADWDAYWTNNYFEADLTLPDLVIGFLVTGYFPVFPWIAYTLAGYSMATLLFPHDSESPLPSLRPVMLLGATMIGLAMLGLAVRGYVPAVVSKHILTGWRMYPPSLEYISTTIGGAMLLFALLHHYVDRNEQLSTESRVFLLVKTFSRYAFTIYLLHHIVHLWPLWIYGMATGNEATAYWQKAMPITLSMPLAVVFLAGCYAVLSRLDPDDRYGVEGWMRWLCG